MDRRRARNALERDLAPRRAQRVVAPPKGWIRAIRDALGMTTRELADRLGVRQPAIVQLEQAEAAGGITLETLRRVADALGCDLEYALVPRKPLDELVRDQARKKARAQIDRVDATMALEGQRTDADVRERELEMLADELIDKRGLWS